jgi:hypothetical protein
MKTWEEFNTRFTNISANGRAPLDFYGCVDAEGKWFDSSDSFEIAVHWCCYSAGQFGLSNEDEVKWMTNEGHKLGYSIIHGTMLKQMFEKGLIK